MRTVIRARCAMKLNRKLDMNTELQIVCEPGAWNKSTFSVVGARKNGRLRMPQKCAVEDLPERWFAVWCAMVEQLRGVAPGEWAAVYISAKLVEVERVIEPADEAAGEPGVVETVPAVALRLRRVWDDGTTAEPVELVMEDAAAVAFFEYLTA